MSRSIAMREAALGLPRVVPALAFLTDRRRRPETPPELRARIRKAIVDAHLDGELETAEARLLLDVFAEEVAA